MKFAFSSPLYAITDRALAPNGDVLLQAQWLLTGGAKLLQYRDKDVDDATFSNNAIQLQALCKAHGATFVVNDRVQIAVDIAADGVHVGQKEIKAWGNIRHIRRAIGDDMILGISAQSLDHAVRAETQGADYIGLGAVYPSTTKPDAVVTGTKPLRSMRSQVQLPVVAIGGLAVQNMKKVMQAGASAVAMISAINKSTEAETHKAMGAIFTEHSQV